MEKADLLYFEVEDPDGINLIMFRDSSVTFSAKIRKKIRCVLGNKPFNAGGSDMTSSKFRISVQFNVNLTVA